jgi:hypothetical protein
LAIVAGLTAVAAAVIGTTAPKATPAPVEGLVRLTEGTVIVTRTAVEVAVKLFESVTRAVRLAEPAVAGVQLNEYGAVNDDPSTVVPERKSTRLTVAPEGAVALAVRLTAAPKPREEALAGLVSETVVSVLVTVTSTSGEVAVLRLGDVPVVTVEVSVTTAVSV